MNSKKYKQHLLDSIQSDDEQLDSCSQDLIDTSSNDSKIKTLINSLTDSATSAQDKLLAIQQLHVISNFSPAFTARLPDYVNALRGLLDDADEELRSFALSGLAMLKDEIAQKRLQEELHSEKAECDKAIPTHKAIAMLGVDDKALDSDFLQKVVENPPDDESLIEAIRHIPADQKSLPTLVKVMMDETKPSQARTIVSNMVNTYDPSTFMKTALDILENKTATINEEVARNLVEGASKLVNTKEKIEPQGFRKLSRVVHERPELVKDIRISKALSKIEKA